MLIPLWNSLSASSAFSQSLASKPAVNLLLFLSVYDIQHVFSLDLSVIVNCSAGIPQMSANFSFGNSMSHTSSSFIPCFGNGFGGSISFSFISGAGSGAVSFLTTGSGAFCSGSAGCVGWQATSRTRLSTSKIGSIFFIFITLLCMFLIMGYINIVLVCFVSPINIYISCLTGSVWTP